MVETHEVRAVRRVSFEAALEEHLDTLWTLCRRLTESSQDAEDLLQDTCLAGWRAWERDGPPRDPKAWLVTICLNQARTRWRTRRARPPARPVAEIADDTAQQTAWLQTVHDVDAQAVCNLEADAVHRQLRELSPTQRHVVVLMDLCGFTAAQTAELLDVPRNTVLSRAHRGHRALALLLADWRPTT